MGQRFFKQTIRDVDLEGATVLVRVDYNLPLDKKGRIADDLRVRSSLPTLHYLLDKNCKIVLISHLGRPKDNDKSLSLSIVAEHLAKLINRPVKFVDDCVGDKVRQVVRHSGPGSITLLENLRFHKEEETNNHHFAQSIVKAVRPDYFVQDGFGVVHRSHASTQAITLCVPSVAGLLLVKEYQTITDAMAQPEHPLVAIIGGAKIADKIGLIKRFIDKADKILIGGAMANTFLAYKGLSVGASLAETDENPILDEIYDLAAKKVGPDKVDEFLLLPSDVAVGKSVDEQQRREVKVSEIGEDDMALDIGSLTIDRYDREIAKAKMVIWNGPVGYSDTKVFSIGSARMALAIARNQQVKSIIGGGDTANFILKWDGHDGESFSHISTGGGASLELMSGNKLPGIESLLDAHGMG
ncbi:phosphoglycerate kinase [Candidatus Saccharibacteria bacterium]|nr:MAG: phosphoglycerate kinase [Candidatus Saccharibacteria bacterium]